MIFWKINSRAFCLGKAFLFFLCFFIFSHFSYALVDMRNANYLETWTDMSLDGMGFDLRVVRAYNSRCLKNGLFGYGWCSDFESHVQVTAEGGLKLVECGCGLEVDYKKKNFNPDEVEKTVQKIMAIVRKRNKDLKPKDLAKLTKEIRNDRTLREEFVKQLKLEGKIEMGVHYFSTGGEADSMILKDSYYLRSLPNGSFQRYSRKTGKLIAIYDKNQNFIKISYQNVGKEPFISQILDNDGRRLSFFYKGEKVSKIQGPGKLVSEYRHKKEDLIWVRNAKNETLKYSYDDLHNMTRIDFGDRTFKEIRYNKDKDWVISFRDRNGCQENYTYKAHPKDPLNRYSSKVVKTCKGKVVHQSLYQFVHRKYKNRPGRYLYKAEVNKNGSIFSTVYHPKFGKPSIVIRNKERTIYRYYSDGRLKEKQTKDALVKFVYNNSCRKVSSMSVKYFSARSKKRISASSNRSKARRGKKGQSAFKVVKTNLFYSKKKCNLMMVKNSEGQKVSLKHDRKGRVSFMKDQAEREVRIQYHDIFDKPSVIHRPGIGTIRIQYKSNGEVKKIESKKGPVVAAQVANVLSHLMDVITPVASHIVL